MSLQITLKYQEMLYIGKISFGTLINAVVLCIYFRRSIDSSGNFQVMYCDQNCQKIHWFTHKKVCKTLKEIHEKQELEAAKEKKKQEKRQKKG